MWNEHCESRLETLLRGGVPIHALEQLACLIVEHAADRSEIVVAVGLKKPVADPTGRNYTPPDVVGAVLRWCGNGRRERKVTTMFLSRRGQFRGWGHRWPHQSAEEHFDVSNIFFEEEK